MLLPTKQRPDLDPEFIEKPGFLCGHYAFKYQTLETETFRKEPNSVRGRPLAEVVAL